MNRFDRAAQLASVTLLLVAGCREVPTDARSGDNRPTASLDQFSTGYILRDGVPVKVTFEIRSGRGIYEGDIDLGPVEKIARTAEELLSPEGLQPGVVVTSSSRWPGGVIPYGIAEDVWNQSQITAALDSIQRNMPGVQFVLWTGQSDFITFNTTTDPDICGLSEGIGRQGGWQKVRLNNSNFDVGCVIHEVHHALGFWHEQSRCDRDNFVEILWGNILPGRADQFTKQCGGVDVDVYDEGSVMHYPKNAFGIGGAQTIRSLRGLDSLMGSRRITAVDARTMNWMYPVPAPTMSLTYPGNVPTLTWNAMRFSPPYSVRLYYVYSSWGSGGGQSWETTSGFQAQTAGTSIQDPYHQYTGSTYCIRFTGGPLNGWRKDYYYEVIATYPYFTTPRATIPAAVVRSTDCQYRPPGP